MAWLLLGTSLLSDAACGGNSEEAPADAEVDQPNTEGGVADAAATSAAGGEDAGVAMAPSTVTCGTKTCTQVQAPGFSTPAVCCFNETSSVCGTKAANGKCAGPPELDPRCPEVVIFAMPLKGCCINDVCGADSSAVGMGCVSLADTTFRMLATNPPEPRRCDAIAGDGGSTAEAGTKDGGN